MSTQIFDDTITDPNEYEYVFFNDGNTFFCNSDSDEEKKKKTIYVEEWIDNNLFQLSNVYNDYKNFDLGQKASFSDFCEYIFYSEHVQMSDIDNWIEEIDNYTNKIFGVHNATMREFAAHFYKELIAMYTFLERNSTFCIGPMEDFIDFIYLYSEHVLD